MGPCFNLTSRLRSNRPGTPFQACLNTAFWTSVSFFFFSSVGWFPFFYSLHPSMSCQTNSSAALAPNINSAVWSRPSWHTGTTNTSIWYWCINYKLKSNRIVYIQVYDFLFFLIPHVPGLGTITQIYEFNSLSFFILIPAYKPTQINELTTESS